MPVFNAENCLETSLKKLTEQSLKEIEIVCVNDGSTDKSGEILALFAEKDKRFNVIAFEKNKGVATARNEALNLASGEFVAFCDADDSFFDSVTLETLYKTAIENEAFICGGSMAFVTPIKIDEKIDGFMFEKDGFVEYEKYQFDYGFTRFIYKKELIANERFSNLTYFEDPPFFVKVLDKAKRFYALNEPTYLCFNKQLNCSKSACQDAFRGILENFKYAKKRNLKKLETYTKFRFEEFFKLYIEKRFSVKEAQNIVKKEPELFEITKAKFSPLQRIFGVKNHGDQKIVSILNLQIKLKRKPKNDK